MEKISEQNQIDRLINRHEIIQVGKRNLKFYQPFLKTLYRMADVTVKAKFDEEKLAENPTAYAAEIKKQNAKLFARYFAYAWLCRPWLIALFGRIVTIYFYNNLRPSDLMEGIIKIKTLENDPAFINSTRLLAQLPRISHPKADLVEEQKTA